MCLDLSNIFIFLYNYNLAAKVLLNHHLQRHTICNATQLAKSKIATRGEIATTTDCNNNFWCQKVRICVSVLLIPVEPKPVFLVLSSKYTVGTIHSEWWQWMQEQSFVIHPVKKSLYKYSEMLLNTHRRSDIYKDFVYSLMLLGGLWTVKEETIYQFWYISRCFGFSDWSSFRIRKGKIGVR